MNLNFTTSDSISSQTFWPVSIPTTLMNAALMLILGAYGVHSRSSHQRCSTKRAFLKTSENLQENTCVGATF